MNGPVGKEDGQRAPQVEAINFISRLRSKSPRQLYEALAWRLKKKKLIATRKVNYTYGCYVLPWLFERRTFPMTDIDRLTRLSSGRSHALIFVDSVEVEAHKKLYHDTAIFEAKYPTRGKCRCNGEDRGKDVILSPLSGLVGGDQIDEVELAHFIGISRPCRHIPRRGVFTLDSTRARRGIGRLNCGSISRIGASRRRLFPESSPWAKWPAIIWGWSGFASNSLRNAQACCDRALVIGFIGISKGRYRNPRFVYGEGVGIRWIEEDGSFEPDTFQSRQSVPTANNGAEDLPSILCELAGGPVRAESP